MDPSRNNMPLDFNKNKGKPPIIYTSGEDDGGSDVSSTVSAATLAAATAAASSTNTALTNSQYNMPDMGSGHMDPWNNGSNMAMTSGNMNGSMMGPMGPMGPNMMMGPMNMAQFPGMMGMGPMMIGDGMGMGGPMGPMGPLGPMGPPPSPMQPKEMITLKSCVLYPPHPDAPPHSVRERPPGCRTAFIGGLPENITEEILEEVFEKSGPIETIRLGKKNFAHIRFINHDSVEQAMYLSGYRMKIDNKDDKPNTGRIHVDYANARNDQHEFECEQRALAREMRHQQQIQEERMRVPSPPPAKPFTIYDGNTLLEAIKSDTGFMKGSQQLITWLDKGNVDKRTANLFYSLIQSSNAHVRRLLAEKQQHEEEVNQAKLLFRQHMQGILVQFGQIESVFTHSKKQRNWDHFTKAQRKNIDTWFKQVQEERLASMAVVMEGSQVEEMDFSDSDMDNEPSAKKCKPTPLVDPVAAAVEAAQLASLKEENDSLKCQLEAYVNEAEMVKLESRQKAEGLEKQIKSLQNALQGMQQQLIAAQTQNRSGDKTAESRQSSTDKKSRETETVVVEDDDEEKEAVGPAPARNQEDSISSSGISLTDKEARVLALVSCFLNVHPGGATVDYLWSYLSQLIPKVRVREVEDLLDRLPNLFVQEVAGVGATLERRWRFMGFQKEKVSTPTS